MLKYCVKKWDKNKNKLEEAIRSNPNLNSCDYTDLVELVIEYILNDEEADFSWKRWNAKEITIIDNGDYQGTIIYLFHKDTYQPSASDYLATYCDYGSCSGCDTLLAIQDYAYNKPLTDSQVSDYMTLCLHIIQRMVRPFSGWVYEEEFEEYDEEKEKEYDLCKF